MGQVSFFAHRLVFPGAPRALGLYRTSRGSLANEPFGAHKFLNQMRIGDSDEIAGCRRVLSYGPSLRWEANISMAFWGAPQIRDSSCVPHFLCGPFSFFVNLSKLGLHPTGCANLVLRFKFCEFRAPSVSMFLEFRERWSKSRSLPHHRSRHYLFDSLARWL